MTALPQSVKTAPQVGLLDDIVLRRPQPIASLSATDPELNLVFEYWNSCRQDGMLPRRKDIDVLQLKPVLGHTHLVDVSAQDPADYRFRLYGSKVRLDRFRNYSNTRVGDYPSIPYRTALIEDYSSVAWSGSPLYQHVVARLQSVRYSYSRLLLPLAEDGRRVNMLVVCTRDRVYPDFSA
jgi:hypothetical protein